MRSSLDKSITTPTKDTGIVYNKNFEQLNKNLSYIHYDIHKKTNDSEDKFLGATYDTVFTVFITLFVFIAGIIIDRILKARQETSEQKDIRNYFFNQLKEIIFAIGPNLTKGYKKYYQNEISIDGGIPSTPPKVLANNFERLHKLESVKLYGSFSKKEQEQFNEYFSHIDFLTNLLREVDGFHNLILRRSEMTRSELSPLTNDFYNKLVQFVQYIEANNPNFKNDQNYKFVIDKLLIFKNEVAGKRALKLFHNKILVPTIEYFKNHNLHTQNEIGIEVYSSGKSIMTKYHELKFLVTEVKLQYRIFYRNINDSIIELKRLNEER